MIMHFSIPDTEVIRTSEASYTVYKVFINGKYHASMRYSQFLSLHEKLGQVGGIKSQRPSFPPKKLLPLSPTQLEDRRTGLEKYMQSLGGTEDVVASDVFRTYLRHVQHESSGEQLRTCSIHVFLSNGQERIQELPSNAPTSTLLRMVGEDLGVSPDKIGLFALYFFRRTPNGLWKIVGRLEDYECPCVSLRLYGDDTRIVFRKSRWESATNDLLEADPVGLHLLYVQTVADIESGWIQVDKEKLHALAVLQTQGKKGDYVRLAKTLKFFGALKFPDCSTHFSSPMTVYIGNREMTFISNTREELIFKVTRIKCWRISLQHEKDGKIRSELAFEYLAGKDNLEWLSIVSDEAVLMGLCLQEVVQEMLAKENSPAKEIRKSSASSSDAGSSSSSGELKIAHSNQTDGTRRSSTDFLVGKRNRSSRGGSRCVLENSVFAGIGDDDL